VTSLTLPSQLSALLSYGDGVGHEGPCVDKSWDFGDARSELFGDGGSGLIDDCENVISLSSYLPSTLLLVLLSRRAFNDPCNDISECGDGGPRLIDDCDKISSTLSASPVE